MNSKLPSLPDPQLDYEVIIVGAGPAGVTVANLLGNYGIKTLVVDREAEILTMPRAVGMCDEGQRIMHATGLLPEVEKDLFDVDDVYFMSEDDRAKFRFDCGSKINGYQILRTLYQPKFEEILRNGLNRFSCVDFFTSAEFLQFEDLNSFVRVGVRHQGQRKVLSCRYLLACDGAKSSIRKMCGIEFTGYTYAQDWLVVDVANDPSADRSRVEFLCDPDRPGVTLPTPNNSRRWEFVIKAGESREKVCTDEFLQELLEPWGKIEEMQITRKTVYTFHALQASEMRHGNVFLLGDAAHLTPPFAGQGMMAGLRDAINLAWKIAYVLRGQLPDQFLDSYQSERHPQAKIIINVARLMGLIILPQNKLLAGLRDLSLAIARKIFSQGEELPRAPLRKVPNNVLGFKGLLKAAKAPHDLELGFEIPDYALLDYAGKPIRMDEFLDQGFYLLSYDCDLSAHLSAAVLGQFISLGGKLCTVHPHAKDELQLNQLKHRLVADRIGFDAKGHIEKALQQGELALLVRPDGIVAIKTKLSQLNAELQKYFAKDLHLDKANIQMDSPQLELVSVR